MNLRSHHIILAACRCMHDFEKDAYYSSMEKDRPYFITDPLARLIIDFKVPVPRGDDGHSFLKRRKKIKYTQSLSP